jgi:CO/xanthine dehydrogenase FAD-binding subunit
MRSNPAEYDLIAPPSLTAALDTLAREPGVYTPISGGTELMVALGAGRLQARKLLSLHHLKELRFIEVTADSILLGAATTFTDLRRHPTVASDLPLLVEAASWTGSIANQNRGTLGGNLVNASPAADSPPALLVYAAEVTLVSSAGTRKLPYCDFHRSYKKTALRPDELLYSITVPRHHAGFVQYIRKVGTRNAQAIAKVALAAIARVDATTVPAAFPTIQEIRLAAASLCEIPARLRATEHALTGQPLTPETIARARAALATEVRPIDDIRSTARYRAAVAANLLEEFLRSLTPGSSPGTNPGDDRLTGAQPAPVPNRN